MSSSVEGDTVMSCAACGASIYQEHLHRGLAGMWGGKLLCPSCLKEARGPGEGEPQPEVPAPPEELPLTDAAESAGILTAMDSHYGATDLGEVTGRGARGVRTFHSKMTEGAVRHMNEQINKWLGRHPEIEIKFASTTVGVWEAKHAEPNLIITVFY